MVWNANYPLSSTDVCGSTEQIRDNWAALEAWWNKEHYDFSSASSGQHDDGRSSVLAKATTSEISAISSPGTGAIAYDTTKGELDIYRWDSAGSSAGWERLTEDVYSRVRYGFDSQVITANTYQKVISASSSVISGYFDGLSEMSSANDKITLSGTAYYWVHGEVEWTAHSERCRKIIMLRKNGGTIAQYNTYGNEEMFISVNDIVSLTAGDYIELYVWHNASTTLTASKGIIHLTRLS